MGTVGRLAAGLSDDLIGRAADVMLKERRKLILVPRETPLHAGHLENLLHLQRLGAYIDTGYAFFLQPACFRGSAGGYGRFSGAGPGGSTGSPGRTLGIRVPKCLGLRSGMPRRLSQMRRSNVLFVAEVGDRTSHFENAFVGAG